MIHESGFHKMETAPGIPPSMAAMARHLAQMAIEAGADEANVRLAYDEGAGDGDMYPVIIFRVETKHEEADDD